MGDSPWGYKESDMTERLTTTVEGRITAPERCSRS